MNSARRSKDYKKTTRQSHTPSIFLAEKVHIQAISAEAIKNFRSIVWKYWNEHGRRTLPWRRTRDPYRVLVSEIMLQQTQVGRVIPYYRSFLGKFPTVHHLACASLAEVLKVWSGLGYNRRAKFLHDAARAIVGKHRGCIPKDTYALQALPGIGPYTASAIRIFAFEEPDVLVETNIRATLIHHFFQSMSVVHDRAVEACAREAAKGQDSRMWHWALMDYGAYLKRSGVRNNHKSAHYTRQSKFEGSLREVRGAIVRALYGGGSIQALKFPKKKINDALATLIRDGLIAGEKGS